jgi:hypothetical protein
VEADTCSWRFFNYGEFATIKGMAGLNSYNYKIGVKEWVAKTNDIGVKATSGKCGGTYAHKDSLWSFLPGADLVENFTIKKLACMF